MSAVRKHNVSFSLFFVNRNHKTMKASELRIGNLLEFSNGIVPSKIITVGRRFFSSASVNGDGDGDFQITPYYKPITLNEDWLMKFGFDKNFDFLLRKKGFSICFEKVGNKLNCYLESIGIDIQYVHQLQNLYFALVGKELVLQD